MVERKVLVVCGLVGFLGLLSAALGFGAEATRIKPSQVTQGNDGLCSFRRSPAYALGVFAAISLLIAQVIINASTGCICCRRSPNPVGAAWALALVCFVVSWFIFAFAFLLMLGGAFLNNKHNDSLYMSDNYYCYVVKSGVFATASVLSFISVSLGIGYYLALTTAKYPNVQWVGGAVAPNESGIAMGQPVVPPVSQDPVFVHEDTYIRRQFT
ncbi:hypothetical protein Droror1_Dr00013002 [Drosera rotundifolia]